MDTEAVERQIALRRDRNKAAGFLTDFNRKHYTIKYEDEQRIAPGGPNFTYLGQRRWKTKSGKPIL